MVSRVGFALLVKHPNFDVTVVSQIGNTLRVFLCIDELYFFHPLANTAAVIHEVSAEALHGTIVPEIGEYIAMSDDHSC